MAGPHFANTYEPLFDSAWLKLTHGMGHAKSLDAEITGFSFEGHDPALLVRSEYDAKRHGFAVSVEDVAPVPAQWGLMLGDIAHNYRSSLDHLAWALVSRGRKSPATLTPEQRDKVQFPVADSRERFNKAIKTRLPGARRADIAIVRRGQPYHSRSPHRRQRHHLTLLGLLNNRDKHRTLQPVWVQPTRLDIEINRMQDCEVPRLGFPRRATPLQVGTEITFVRARKRGPNPRLEVRPHVMGEASIENRISVRTWIAQCGVFTALLLREFSEPPEELAIPELWAWLAESKSGAFSFSGTAHSSDASG